MTPAEHVIEKLGGHAIAAQICGVHITRVRRWAYPRSRGGCDGIIPSQRQVQLLAAAKIRGIELSPADFFPAEAEEQGSAA